MDYPLFAIYLDLDRMTSPTKAQMFGGSRLCRGVRVGKTITTTHGLVQDSELIGLKSISAGGLINLKN